MADMMTFPETVEEFMEQYKITDTEQIYSNGMELVPISRMKQWFAHKPEQKRGKWEHCRDDDGEYDVCSLCGMDVDISYSGKSYKFCPHCGADMRGES